MIWRIRKYIQHLFYRRHRKGYGIHSPYVFEFIHDIIFNRAGISVPEEVARVHRIMMKDCSPLPEEGGREYGAGSHTIQARTLTVRQFVKRSSVSSRYGSLLFRISGWFRPEVMLELGTGVGISAMYLAAGTPSATLYTVEGNSTRSKIAGMVIKRSGLNNVKVYREDLDQALDSFLANGTVGGRFLAFVDGNHRYEPSVRYVEKLMGAAGDEALILMDDIYWSKGMQRAWTDLSSRPEVACSIDLYNLGILVMGKDLNKTHLKIKF